MNFNRNIITVMTISALCTLGSALPAGAQNQERHAGSPDYLKVRSNLQEAQRYLREPEDNMKVKREEDDAVRILNVTIADVLRAAHSEGDNSALDPVPEVPHGERLKFAEHAIDNGWAELRHSESDASAMGARADALQHIHDAMEHVLRAEGIYQRH